MIRDATALAESLIAHLNASDCIDCEALLVDSQIREAVCGWGDDCCRILVWPSYRTMDGQSCNVLFTPTLTVWVSWCAELARDHDTVVSALERLRFVSGEIMAWSMSECGFAGAANGWVHTVYPATETTPRCAEARLTIG